MYRVETSTRTLPDLYFQDGPTCTLLASACELLDALMDDPRLAGVRIRDLDRNPDTQDPIILAVYKGRDYLAPQRRNA